VPAADAGVPQLKSYPDSVYFNYFSLGLSLLFRPQNGYKPKAGLSERELENENLVLDSVDIYNTPKVEPSYGEAASKRSTELVFSQGQRKAQAARPSLQRRRPDYPMVPSFALRQLRRGGNPDRVGGPRAGAVIPVRHGLVDVVESRAPQVGGGKGEGELTWGTGDDQLKGTFTIAATPDGKATGENIVKGTGKFAGITGGPFEGAFVGKPEDQQAWCAEVLNRK
jgi:hypothetical protein